MSLCYSGLVENFVILDVNVLVSDVVENKNINGIVDIGSKGYGRLVVLFVR